MKKYNSIVESVNNEPTKDNLWLHKGYLKYFGPNGWSNLKSDINDTDVVHKTGAEVISGVKTFNDPIVIPAGNSPEEAVRLEQLIELASTVNNSLSNKVDAEAGKSLISNTEILKLSDYPTLGTSTDKFVRGDGTLANIAVGSGGYAANLYLSNVASDINGYKTLTYDNDITPTSLNGTSVNNAEVLIEEFAFPLGLNTTSIDAGSWKFSLNGRVSNTGAETYARIKVFKRSTTGTETQLFSLDSAELNNLTDERIVFEAIEPIFTTLDTDRLVIKLYVFTTSNANKTLTINIGGINSSYFNTPLPIRHNQLRDLNGDPNVQHMTADEKFAIGGVVRKAFGYKFDGVDDLVVIQHNNLFNTNSNGFSIELLFKLTQPISQKILLSKVDTGADALVLSIGSGNIVEFKLTIGGVAYPLVTPLPTVGKDCHAIFSYVNRKMLIYINGELSSALDVNSDLILNTSSVINIGGITSYKYAGNISLIRFYKRGFAQTDVDYYYNMGRPDLSRLSYSDKVNKTTTGCVLELLPENATTSKWLDTQNGLDGVTSGAPAINYGNVTPEPYVYPFKKYIGLEQNGDGTGFARFSVITNKTGKAIVSGGVFVDSTGSNEIGKELTLYKDIQTNIYVKLLSQFGDIEFDNLIYLSDFAKGNNDPIIAPFTSELPIKFGAYGTATTAVNKLYGSVSLIPRNVIDLRLSIPANVSGLTVGDYKELPRGIEYLFLNNTKISGDLSGIPRKVKVLYLGSSTGINGLIKDIPDSCVRLTLSGTNTVSGNLSDLKGTIELMTLYGINVTYSGNLKFNTSVDTIIISPTSNIFTSAMTDQILIDLAAQVTTAIGSKVINLIGSCGAPTSASSDARTYLSGLGFTVTTN